MIHYSLACDSGHTFESWFPSGAAYDEQVARGLVACPVCDSTRVGKGVMAPAVARRDLQPAAPKAAPVPQAPGPGSPAAPQPMALLSEPERQLRAMLRAVREHVVANSEHVGDRFAAEARRMHEGEIEQRSIYGEATADDARALLEDGIEVHPLPVLPDDRH